MCGWICEMIRKNNTSKKCYIERKKIMRPHVSAKNPQYDLSRHLINDVIDSRLRKARHQLVDDFLHEQIRHTGTAALGELK